MDRKKFIYCALAIILFPAIAQANPRIHAEWQYIYNENLAGFRLYHENNLACEINDPTATSIDCDVEAPDGETWFTLTSFLNDDTESPHSEPYVYIISNDLKAVISTDIDIGNKPLPIEFNGASSSGNIFTYDWVFGDGNIASGSIVNHTYSLPGSYTVTLKVTDNIGAIDRETTTIVVTTPTPGNTPPIAAITSTQSVGTTPLIVEFDAKNSKDNDGTIVSYHWDMGDGHSAKGAKVTHTYNTVGTYNPTLTVTDDGGLTDTISTPVIVKSSGTNVPPTAVISVDSKKGKAPLRVTFSSNNSTDPDGVISFCAWHFGDGSSSKGESASHTFSKPGKYTVSLCVTDNKGAESLPAKIVIEVQGDDDNQQQNNAVKILPIIDFLLNKSRLEE